MNIIDLHNQFIEQIKQKKELKLTFGFMPEPCKMIESHIKKTDVKLYTLICGIRDRVSFTRRRYAGTGFYCWAHSGEVEIPSDPWPAVTFPKSVLFVEIAHAIELGKIITPTEVA